MGKQNHHIVIEYVSDETKRKFSVFRLICLYPLWIFLRHIFRSIVRDCAITTGKNIIQKAYSLDENGFKEIEPEIDEDGKKKYSYNACMVISNSIYKLQ